MAIYLSNRDGGKTDEQGHYKFQTAAFKGNVLESGFTVTQNSPLGMSVIVGGGDAKIPYSDYAYTAWIPDASPETVAVTTANPSNPRIDRLVLYVDRGETPSSGTANNPTIPKLMLVAGTPAGSPSRPSNGTVNTAVSSNPYIDLADILVGAGVTQITNANITRTAVGAYPVIASDAKVIGNANLKDGVGELGGAWTAYTPTSTSVTLGTGSLQGWYTKIGKTIHGRIRLSLGSGGSISGTIVLGLPEVVAPELKTSQGYFIGTAKILDAGVAEYPLDIIVNGDQEVKFYADSTSASYAKSINVNSTVPVASGLGNGDVLLATFTYEAA